MRNQISSHAQRRPVRSASRVCTSVDAVRQQVLEEQLRVRAWTHSDLAAAAGMTSYTVGRLVRGEGPISTLHTKKLARAFGMKPAALHLAFAGHRTADRQALDLSTEVTPCIHRMVTRLVEHGGPLTPAQEAAISTALQAPRHS